MKIYKTLLLISAIPLILYSVLGNIYAFLFTYKELKSEIETKYNGLLEIVGYEYDPQNKSTVFFVEDNDGLRAGFSYNEKTNDFFDEYGYVSSRVSYYTVRGDIMNKIVSSGIIPEDTDIVFKPKVGIINGLKDESIVPEEVLITINDSGSKEDFCDTAVLLIKPLAKRSIAKITVKSDSYILCVSDGMMSSEKNDILASIRPNYG